MYYVTGIAGGEKGGAVMAQRAEKPFMDTFEERTYRVLDLAVTAAAPHGVTALGVCTLPPREKMIPCRSLSRVPQEGSAVMMLLPYYTGEHDSRNVARYAICDDYHTVAGEILADVCAILQEEFPQGQFLPFVDSSPLPEVDAACRAGLGYRGRNGQLIAPIWGSRVFICEVITDLKLAPTTLSAGVDCGSCRRCIEACPTGAITDQGFEKKRCRSFITQKKGSLEPWEAVEVAAGGLVWGCDICTDVCPWNKNPLLTSVFRLQQNLAPHVTSKGLEALLVQKSYGWRGRRVLERNLELIQNQEEPKVSL